MKLPPIIILIMFFGTPALAGIVQGSISANGPFCGSGNGQLTWTASSGTGPFVVIYLYSIFCYS